VLVMAHGFSLTWRQGLLPTARACVASGCAVLLFDHRSFGDSDGLPRNVVDWWGQLRGYVRAIDFLSSGGVAGVDATRIALYGFSLSGAQALTLAAIDPRVKALVAVAPGPIDVPIAPRPSAFACLQRELSARTSAAANGLESEVRLLERSVGDSLPVVRAHGPWPVSSRTGKEQRGNAWFGQRIPGEADAQRFFGRRGGPLSEWTNKAAQVLQALPDWDEAVRDATPGSNTREPPRSAAALSLARESHRLSRIA